MEPVTIAAEPEMGWGLEEFSHHPLPTQLRSLEPMPAMPALGESSAMVSPMPASALLTPIEVLAQTPAPHQSVSVGVMNPAEGSASFDDRLFDRVYYLAQNPDVAAHGIDPLQHFRSNGWREGRNPSPWFSLRFYLREYPDVAATGINPLAHYATHGWMEGRSPSEAFSVPKYLAAYPDVAAARLDPLLHYILDGKRDGRTAFHI